jgi:quinoprotein glucose dehydrogenase
MRLRHATLVLPLAVAGLLSQGSPAPQPWPIYAGDNAAAHYSALSDIDATNVARLTVAWEWSPSEQAMAQYGTQPGNFQNTPLMIDNVLYVSTPYNRVVALDADTGKELWSYDPKAYEDGQPPNGTGFVHRGVAAWHDASASAGRNAQTRIFLNSRWRLIALDARTGEPITTFGTNGIVDSDAGPAPRGEPGAIHEHVSACHLQGPGHSRQRRRRSDCPTRAIRPAMSGRSTRAPAGRSGGSTRCQAPGSFGNDTWGNESWKVTGHTNVWAPMSLDDQRGLLYLPVSTPSNDFYGGNRPGMNLFGESLVCLDAATGARKWHFQIVHHGLWDYDPASAPALADRHDRRPPRGCGRAADQTRFCVCLRSCDRQAGLADRGTRRAGQRCRGRARVTDAAVSNQTARHCPAGDLAGRGV